MFRLVFLLSDREKMTWLKPTAGAKSWPYFLVKVKITSQKDSTANWLSLTSSNTSGLSSANIPFSQSAKYYFVKKFTRKLSDGIT